MNTVTCSCSKCHSWIGKFDNLWDKIGKTYYSPVSANPNGLGGLVMIGEAREAAKTGVIENSFLQDLACKGCGQKLGLRCDSVPEGHILVRDQLILRIGGMAIVADDTGRRASLRVRNKYSLTGQQACPANTRDDRDRSASLVANHIVAENDLEPPVDAVPLSVAEGDPLPGLIRFAEWAEHTIAGQKEDIDRISDVVSKIERDMKSFKDFMTDTRQELDTVPKGGAWERVKRSINVIEDEVGNMRAELDERPIASQRNDDEGVNLSVEELEVLTNSITKISHKVNEVDSLKMELQFMKSRLKRFEDASRNFRQSVEPRNGASSPAPSVFGSPRPPQVRREASRDAMSDARNGTPRDSGLPRKRKSDEYESNGSSLRTSLSAADNNKAHSLDAPIGHRRTSLHKPSRLSNVQLLDDMPDPISADPFADSNDNYNHPQLQTTRDYDSAPEGRPRRFIIRNSSSPEATSRLPPQRSFNKPALPAPRPRAPLANMLPTEPSRRRAYSEGVRNADGIRITKSGTPDRRAANGRNLKQYYEKLRLRKEMEKANGGGGGGGGGDENVGVAESGGGGNETVGVLPSIEKESGSGSGGVVGGEAVRRAELEARERLVRETLEREI